MSGRVVFALTDHQARALVAVSAGSPIGELDGRIVTALVQRGLLVNAAAGPTLTPLGRAASAIAERLAIAAVGAGGD